MRISLALGSGGARGYAHLGVLDALAARNWDVVDIAGTSMGALVGGAYAAGKVEEFTEFARSLVSQRDVIRYVDPALRGAGVIKADRILGRMADIIGEVLIEDLEIPYTAVAVDLFAHREVWFQRGPLLAAIRASIAIPTVITPVVIKGRVLVDGGVVNPVPIEPTLSHASDLTVAVSLSGRRGERHPGPLVRQSAQPQRPDWWTRLRHSIDVSKLRERVNPTPGPDRPAEEEGVFDDLPINLKYADVIQHSMDSQSAMIERFRLAASPPDVLVTIPVDSAAVFDFHRADELIKLGREAAEEALERAGFGLGSAG
ncbi:patatin-like phospholipase family protein [Granulicoccus phenolivorans]|uniref:patatin-like phospholipase family protein n=1 Tax=Granulicoccus phenolivorans TaxID=266854 RepID=UPI00041FC51B|nr:patatin-like phospholipase family protein [Granulicoccus phenolivorans]